MNDVVMAAIVSTGLTIICLILIAFISVLAVKMEKKSRKVVVLGIFAEAILFSLLFPHVKEAINPSLSEITRLVVAISDSLLLASMPLAIMMSICFVNSCKNRD